MAKILHHWAIFSWLKFCPNHWAIFSRKNLAIQNRPNGKISPNLVTLFTRKEIDYFLAQSFRVWFRKRFNRSGDQIPQNFSVC
jgi:hypothetical protein